MLPYFHDPAPYRSLSLWHSNVYNESHSVEQQISPFGGSFVKKISLSIYSLKIVNITREACGT
jgi:hypothetical protein